MPYPLGHSTLVDFGTCFSILNDFELARQIYHDSRNAKKIPFPNSFLLFSGKTNKNTMIKYHKRMDYPQEEFNEPVLGV